MDPLSTWTFNIVLNNTTTLDSKTNLIRIAIIVLCVILSAFFAACETALSYADPYKIETLADKGSKKAKIALKIINHNDKTIIDNLIYINLLHIAASTLMTVLLIENMSDESFATVLSTIIMTFTIFLFSETLPKTVSNLNPEKSLLNLSWFIYLFGIICYPVSIVFRLLVFLLKKVFKLKDENDVGEEEFVNEIEDSESLGLLENEESDIIQAAVSFGDFTVSEVMTKKEDMVCYDGSKSSRKDVLNFVKNVNYTRIPVYHETIDNIIGVLHIKKYLLNCYDAEKQIRFTSMLSKPLFVLPNTKIDDMFELFQQKRNHMAFIKNEQGQVLGMVTMEDVVEKLVGDIDEVNPPKVFDEGGNE